MNFRQIEYILAVARFKSFGKAAEHCFVTQSTLSTMVNRLEQELDIQIFDRKTKPVSITFEGQQLLQQFQVIYKEVNQLDEMTQNLKGSRSGSLHIGIIPTIVPFLFPTILNDFSQTYPHITFQISEIPTQKIIHALKNRDIDVGIVSIPLKTDDLEEMHLYDESFLLYDAGSTKHKQKVEIESIDVNRLWLLEEGHCLKDQVEQICGLRQKKRIHSNLIYQSGTIPTLLKLVEHNQGLTLLPYLSSLELNEAQKKRLRYFQAPVPARQIGLVVHKHFVKKELLQKLAKTIKNKVQPHLELKIKHQTFDPLPD